MSKDELILRYADALVLLELCQRSAIQVLGWEGILRYKGGSLSHSQQHQGMGDFSTLSDASPVAWMKSTIMQVEADWELSPENSSTCLYYCITICST